MTTTPTTAAVDSSPVDTPDPTRRPERRPQATTTAFLRTATPLLVVIVGLALFTGARNPAFLTGNNLQNILSQVAVLGILAAGQTFLLIGGQMDLSVGSLASLVAVLAAREFGAGWSPVAVVAVSLATGAAVGLLWGLIVAYLSVPPFILTLGGLSVFASLALVVSGNTPIPVPDGLSGWGFGTWLGLRAPVVMVLAVMLVWGLALHFSRFGRNTYALGSSRQATYLSGVPVRRLVVALFVLNSTLTAFGGLVLMARLGSGDPRSGSGLELTVIAVIVLGGAALSGGRGTMAGSALGVLVFGVISASLTFLHVPGAYQSLVSGGILIVAVVITAAADLRAGRAIGIRGENGLLATTFGSLLRRRPR